MPAVLELHGIAKSYGANSVLEDLSLAVTAGEILALVGENGAGKSTLMRIAGGYVSASSGQVLLNSQPAPRTVHGSEQAGIVLVHQEFCLAPDLTVAENIFLGCEPRRGLLIDYSRMNAGAEALLRQLGSAVDPKARLATLQNTEWQMVEIAKAFARTPRVLLMDEPTAVLGAREVEALFDRMRAFAEAGGAVVFTSHRLDEVKEIASNVAVLRDGRIRHVGPCIELTEGQMASLMVGRELSQLYPQKTISTNDKIILKVEQLASQPVVHDVSFELRVGEILGIAGLVGSGRTEAFETVAGLRTGTCRTFEFEGLPFGRLPSIRAASGAGLAYLTEDRKGKGLLLDATLAENVSLTLGALRGSSWVSIREEAARLGEAIEQFDIRTSNAANTARSLSGGNQQKVLIAKTLAAAPKVVIFDEPTRGVDIGSKQQIYRFIADLARAGVACVVISSEMQEVIGLSHRVLVMRSGCIAGELAGQDINEDAIVRLAMGLAKEAA